MRINTNDSKEVALCILDLIKSLHTQYGKVTLAKILKGINTSEIKIRNLDKNEFYQSLNAFSKEQIENFISQLTSMNYLKSLNIGTSFEMNVIDLTEQGNSAIRERTPLILNIPKVYTPEFINASEINLIEPEIINEYYKIKIELDKLQKIEEELKNKIKKVMTDNNLPKIHTDKINIYCKKIERIFYSKEKIESYVPEEIKEKIREKKETIILTSKIRKNN